MTNIKSQTMDALSRAIEGEFNRKFSELGESSGIGFRLDKLAGLVEAQ
ncbi:MAG: hypothetical protein HRT67_09380 [Flavobacteriaceae bacterium]|nr:hypothetical protein [Flavobacteriaceae bacterium]